LLFEALQKSKIFVTEGFKKKRRFIKKQSLSKKKNFVFFFKDLKEPKSKAF